MPERNIGGRRRSTSCTGVNHLACAAALLAAIAANVADSPAFPSPQVPGALAADDARSQRPAADGVIAAFDRVRRWLDAFELPAPDTADAVLPIDGASGVCIVLRASGRVVGIGRASGSDDAVLRRAAGRAFGAVLADASIAALRDTLPTDIGRRLTLELEVAGAPQPLLGRTAAQMSRSLEPGLDAVAARRGDRWAMAFPGHLRATGRSLELSPAARSLAAELDLPPADPATLRTEHGVGLYRAACLQLAQARPDAPPRPLFRGDRVVPATDVDIASMRRAADALAQHILGTVVARLPASGRGMLPSGTPVPDGDAGVGGIAFGGDYLPHLDTYRPLVATPLEQALLAYALARYASLEGSDPEVAARARTAARLAVRRLAGGDGGPSLATDASICAGVLLAASTLEGGDDRVDDLVERAQRTIDSALSEAGGPAPTPHALSLIGAAMARRAVTAPDAAAASHAADQARRAMDRAWAARTGARSLTLLPWIVWGEVDLAKATETTATAHDDRLEKLTALLDQLQIGRGGLEGPPDLQGGYALSAAALTGSTAVTATAQSLRPAAAVAVLLRSPEVPGGSTRQVALGRHLHSVRFLLQLTARDSRRWAFRAPKRAIGGVRTAPWDDRQPPAAQAMGLLLLVETLESIAGGR